MVIRLVNVQPGNMGKNRYFVIRNRKYKIYSDISCCPIHARKLLEAIINLQMLFKAAIKHWYTGSFQLLKLNGKVQLCDD